MEPEFSTEEESTGSKIKNNIFELIQFVAVVGAILVVCRFFVAEPHRVTGSSMIPNFYDGDYIITNKLSVKTADPKRGEVIILQNPRDTTKAFIKRIVGLPNERIKILAGQIYINGQLIAEPYLPLGLRTPGEAFLSEGEEITVPEGQYFVIGDNRTGSSDSREWGTVKKELIIGQAWLRYWPIQKFSLIKIDTASN